MKKGEIRWVKAEYLERYPSSRNMIRVIVDRPLYHCPCCGYDVTDNRTDDEIRNDEWNNAQ